MDGTMEQIEHLLALLDRPAFLAENGRITSLNAAAQALALSQGMDLRELLSDAQEAYSEFTGGCLSLTLRLPSCSVPAEVTVLDHVHLFTLEPKSAEAELRMLSLAAQALRDPLTDVMALAETLPQDTPNRGALTRSLYRLLRIVGNMTPQPLFRPEMLELNALLREVWDSAQPACDAWGVRFGFTPSPAPAFTAADGAMLTRAIHNLLSNSMKFSQGREFRMELLRSGGIIRIRFLDPGAQLPPDPFTRYLREPGPEDPRCGIGLGLRLVRNAAIAHRGTALMAALPGGGLVTELRLPIRQDTLVCSNRLRISYTGERSPLLVELSDVLPPEFYK